MTSEQDQNADGRVKPNKAQARQTALMAHAVLTKFKEMGLPDEYDAELAAVCTDLGDLWGAQKALNTQLENLLEGPAEWADVGDALVDLRSTVGHLAWHTESVVEPIETLSRFAYDNASSKSA
jgi:hypothetical protein